MSIIFRSKNEVVYNELHQAILHGDYQPGERIVIDDVASQFGVSAIPIRESLRQLEADGFVEIVPYAGATVTEISAYSIFEVFALLETMEAICARSACQRMSDAEIARLDELVQQMDGCMDDPERWVELNKQFHLQICEYAHTVLIKEMMRKVLDHWDRLRTYYMKDVFVGRVEMAQVEHRQIVAAFYKRDVDLAESLLQTHNQNALTAYNSFLQADGHLKADASI
ncbi:MAG: GntR family transcriptional regulator [Anaerolineales bacterium]|nr:GntR family transcriptional regulator [Anaerolineales bacterium]